MEITNSSKLCMSQTSFNLYLHNQLLQFQDLRVGQEKKSYIGFTQENSIENSIQDGLSYILITHSLYSTTLVYPK